MRLDKFSEKIGFTKTELKVILFLSVVFLFGLLIKFLSSPVKSPYKNFDYTLEDSLFFNSDSIKIKQGDSISHNITENDIDYKEEVLDFNSRKFKTSKTKTLPADKSINLNTADKDLLILLPGIGEKTAQSIITLRSNRGGFKNLDELLDVKGIGAAKFNKIKNFLYIEQ